MLVLDSNTLSYYFRGDPLVVPRLQTQRPADLGVPAIVEYELRYGLMRLPSVAAAPRLAAWSWRLWARPSARTTR
jgi:tRNA(fMet)-specific endonuclease VapC